MFGLVDLNIHDFFKCSFEKVRRGHIYKLFLPTCHSATGFNFFAFLCIWNVLPHDTDFSSLASFKRSLSTNILQKFLTDYSIFVILWLIMFFMLYVMQCEWSLDPYA